VTDSRNRGFKPSFSHSAKGMVFLFLAVASLFVLWPTDVHAQAHEMLGDWQQLTSNAGACPQCRINFVGDGARLRVAANNGWSADVEVRDSDSGTSAVGQGTWRMRAATAPVSKPFSIDFKLSGQRLYMTMVDEANGRRRIVKAVFGRAWLGA
jgi:hypothetical protein